MNTLVRTIKRLREAHGDEYYVRALSRLDPWPRFVLLHFESGASLRQVAERVAAFESRYWLASVWDDAVHEAKSRYRFMLKRVRHWLESGVGAAVQVAEHSPRLGLPRLSIEEQMIVLAFESGSSVGPVIEMLAARLIVAWNISLLAEDRVTALLKVRSYIRQIRTVID